MSTYCYKNEKTNKIYDSYYPMGKAPKFIEVEGVKCDRCFEAEIASQHSASPSVYPMISRALAVHKTQRKQYSEFAKENGVPTHFDEKGHPVFKSKGHRKAYAELVGATDFDGGYGDPRCD